MAGKVFGIWERKRGGKEARRAQVNAKRAREKDKDREVEVERGEEGNEGECDCFNQTAQLKQHRLALLLLPLLLPLRLPPAPPAATVGKISLPGLSSLPLPIVEALLSIRLIDFLVLFPSAAAI